jgi:hypothetical protein
VRQEREGGREGGRGERERERERDREKERERERGREIDHRFHRFEEARGARCDGWMDGWM